MFNGFKLGMLYNTTVTAYEHKSFLFWVKKNNVRRNQRGYETRTSRTLTGGHPPSTPSQWNEIIRAYTTPLLQPVPIVSVCARWESSNRHVWNRSSSASFRHLSTFPVHTHNAPENQHTTKHIQMRRVIVCVCMCVSLIWEWIPLHLRLKSESSHMSMKSDRTSAYMMCSINSSLYTSNSTRQQHANSYKGS